MMTIEMQEGWTLLSTAKLDWLVKTRLILCNEFDNRWVGSDINRLCILYHF